MLLPMQFSFLYISRKDHFNIGTPDICANVFMNGEYNVGIQERLFNFILIFSIDGE